MALLLFGTMALANAAPAAAFFKVTKEQRIAAVQLPNDQLTFSRAEQFLQLDPGKTSVVRVSCSDGLAVDGGALVQQVDQGKGTPADIQVLQSQSIGPSTYSFTVFNPTDGGAQVKLFVTCVKQATTDGGSITLIAKPPMHADLGGSYTATCPVNMVAVAPGYVLDGGSDSVLTASQPSDDLSSWTFVPSSGGVTMQISCMSLTTASDGHSLQVKEVKDHVAVPAGQTVSASLTCPVGYKGMTASYSLDAGLRLLGDEPQPVTREFWFENPTGQDLHATIDLLCLATNTTSAVQQFQTASLTGKVGQTVEYRITMTPNNYTGQLKDISFSDPGCDPGTLAGGPPSDPLPAGYKSVTWTCSHLLTALPFTNTATVTAKGWVIIWIPETVSASATVAWQRGVVPPEAFTALTIPATQTGPQVSAKLTVTKPNSRVLVEVYTPAAQIATTAAKKAPKLVLIGRVLRTHASGRVKITVALNATGRRALMQHHGLTVKVLVRVTPPGGKAQQVTKTATLKS